MYFNPDIILDRLMLDVMQNFLLFQMIFQSTGMTFLQLNMHDLQSAS